MNEKDKRLKEIKYEKYLITIQIRELKKQLKKLKQEEIEKGYIRTKKK